MLKTQSENLKADVRDFWNEESCGTRYMEGEDALERFRAHATARYQLEPYIPGFAGFSESQGKKVLEIGVGLGADFVQWLQNGADATGVDLTPAAIEQTKARLELEGFQDVPLQVSDAENLPFDDETFDLVYSWGVLHHSPDTQRALDEVHRILKPGGTARIMIYRHPSWVGLMIWVRYALLRGKPFLSAQRLLADHLESPGTQAFRDDEARKLFHRFEEIVRFQPQLGPGDTLEIRPSAKYQSGFYRVVWALWPRWLIHRIGNRMGLALMVEVRK